MEGLFSIGDVARMFHMSVSLLRYYERIGILTPEYVSPESGYRYYSARQFEVLNTVRYLRALDMPLSGIADFQRGREVGRMEELLTRQKEAVAEKRRELARVERKIDNRLCQLRDARGSTLDEISLVHRGGCRIVWVDGELSIHGYLDMEAPIRRLDSEREAVIFLGKVGIGISREHLREGQFERYDGIFLIADEEDRIEGETVSLPEGDLMTVRFCGSHTDAPRYYRMLREEIERRGLEICGFSREVTMIDYGFTSNTREFVTEISIPVSGCAERC